MNDPRYPIGRFDYPGQASSQERAAWIDEVAALPASMRQAVERLDDGQLDTPYRPGGWTLRQVVHHVPDSHVNSYVRFKLALTENEPIIKPYDEASWAELPDAWEPIAGSLALLEAIHARWTALLRSMSEADWHRRFIHPDSGPTDLTRALGSYAWHGRHHLAHITMAVTRHGW